MPYCEKNETSFKHFLKKFHELTNDFQIKKMKNLLHLRGKNPHPACVTYTGISTGKENYIGETQLNVEIL